MLTTEAITTATIRLTPSVAPSCEPIGLSTKAIANPTADARAAMCHCCRQGRKSPMPTRIIASWAEPSIRPVGVRTSPISVTEKTASMATRPSGSMRKAARYARSAAVALIVAAASENGMSAPMPGVPMTRFMPRSTISSAAMRLPVTVTALPQCAPLNGVNAPLHLGRCERQRVGGCRPGRRQHARMLGWSVVALNPSMVLI